MSVTRDIATGSSPTEFITIYGLCYTVSPMKGGARNGLLTVHRSAIPPHGVPGFDQLDARGVSATGFTLRGRVSSPYGCVAPRWEAADSAPVCRVKKLPAADTRRSSLLSSHLYENLRAASSPRTPVRHGPEQSQSVDSCPPPAAAGGVAHSRRCPCSLPDGPGPAAWCLRGRRGHCRRRAGGDPCPRGPRPSRRTGLPPFAHDGTERRIVRPQDPAEQKESYSGKK